MQRCLQLARLGAGHVAPNPMVGAVLVYKDRIIGEGWHQQYGQAHAEVNCLAAVAAADRPLIEKSTLYVSLEPCVHFGKTPPCADLIIRHKIPKLFIGCRDPFKEVDGKGIEKLKAAGVEVVLADGLLRYECEKLNKRFFTYHLRQRPYIILKWAQTANAKMASLPAVKKDTVADRLMISNQYSNRLVHRWRSEEAAILVGTNTALLDDPELSNRLWSGSSPIRLVIDKSMRLPKTLKIFNRSFPTIIFNTQLHTIEEGMTAGYLQEKGGSWYYKIKSSGSPLKAIAGALFNLHIQSVIVEGGAAVLQSFLDEGLWDEIRIIQNNAMVAGEGLDAPVPGNAILINAMELFADTIETYVSAKDDQ